MAALTLPPLLQRLLLAPSALRHPLAFSILFARASALPIFSTIIPYLTNLWDDYVLRAVPKKQTSYQKKRSRQLAGKALKDLTSLNHCSACGRVKRMHMLCPYCVQNIKDMFAGRMSRDAQPETEENKATTKSK